MSFADAAKLAYQSCSFISDYLPYYISFVMNDEISLSFHAIDEIAVDSLNLFAG